MTPPAALPSRLEVGTLSGEGQGSLPVAVDSQNTEEVQGFVSNRSVEVGTESQKVEDVVAQWENPFGYTRRQKLALALLKRRSGPDKRITTRIRFHRGMSATEKGTDLIRGEKGDSEEKEKEEGWITPKSGRSPGEKTEELKYGEVSILSNPYSVLEVDDEMEREKQVEETIMVKEVTKVGDVNMENTLDLDTKEDKTADLAEKSETVVKDPDSRAELILRP
ncbi:hypothetical protein ISN44_As08g036940 [Arabidopsis suecica]|uniref:Uncharacterized protein n=1 Tax=Arabidopsis suecica TaxID=45249 RepID=A0A8T2BDZ2_ARASU|nr:hypothetical protein ISN44_As08g036940 [Arabidopsis suecica]